MVPELTICEECGRTVIILSWSPLDERASSELVNQDSGQELEISCTIDCPVCGTRIQNVVATVAADHT